MSDFEEEFSSARNNNSDSPKLGRNRDYLWEHFTDIGQAKTGGHRKCHCKYCSSQFNYAKIILMYRHIAHECQAILQDNPQVRKEVIRRLLSLNNQEQSPEESTRKRLKRNTGSPSSTSSSSNSRQLQIDYFSARSIPLREKQEIDRSLLRAFIMCGMSFHTASNIFFKQFLNKLNSMYVPPDRMKLSRDLLIQETILVESKNDEMLNEAQHLTLNMDGWTDQAGHSLYEYNVVTETRKNVILALKDLSEFNHTATFLTDQLDNVLQRSSITSNIVKKIRAIVTDNPDVMKKMRETFISKLLHQHVLSLRCFGHAINLIACDVVKHSFSSKLLSKLSTVTTYFNQSHKFKAILKAEAKRTHVKKETFDSIGDTRWTTVADCLKSFILLRNPLETILCVHGEALPPKVLVVLKQKQLYREIDNLYCIMRVLAYAVGIIQANSATLADCYLILIYITRLMAKLTAQNDTKEFGRFVSKSGNIRLKEFQNDYYLVCFYLHPKYRGAGMLTKNREIVYRTLADIARKLEI
ncbi:unnamed protein product, partial [Didymodactylos carnosus]